MRKSNNLLVYDMVSAHIDKINVYKVFDRQSKLDINCNYNSVKTDYKAIDQLLETDIKEDKPKKVIKYTTDDKMSGQTQRKMSTAIKYLNHTATARKVQNKLTNSDIRFKLVFITLTLSSEQTHTDNELKNKLLNHFLTEIKKHYNIKHYVWRLEKQANGRAHFHIVCDNFIPHNDLRNMWNRIQNKLGYVDKYQTRMQSLSYAEYVSTYDSNNKYTPQQIKSAWIKGKSSNWQHPNSTDVHSLQYINNIDAYLCKYMTKQEQNKGISGRLWGCSQSLSNITGARNIVDSDISQELSIMHQSGLVREYAGDYFTIFFYDFNILRELKCTRILSMINEYLQTKFGYIDG